MDSIAKFVSPPPPLAPDATVAQAQAIFFKAEDLHALAVADAGRPVGLVTREAALDADGAMSVLEVMHGSPPVVDAETDPLDAASQVAGGKDLKGDGFLICKDGQCIGASSLRALLAAIRANRSAASAEADFKRQLLDLVTFEIQTPLDGMLALAERLERQPLGGDALSQVRGILESGGELKRVLATALDLTRAEHGLLGMTVGPVPLRPLLDDIQADWNQRMQQTGVTLLASFDGDSELVAMTDGARLRQVFNTLLASSLAQTQRGSIEVTLKVAAQGDNLHIEGRVRDTSPGLPPEVLARIFEPQGDRSDPGAMDVALARQIVLGLNGYIRAESNVGAGVSMVFDIVAEAAATAAPLTTQTAFSGAHVLVVDDNATNRMVAEALCEMFDCTSECAEDGVEAVEVASSGRFDVILMDIKMPRMDGMAAARAIRALPGAAGQTPIIALTANVDPEDARAYLACGMIAVVEKPIKPDRLLQAINDALAERTSRQSAAA